MLQRRYGGGRWAAASAQGRPFWQRHRILVSSWCSRARRVWRHMLHRALAAARRGPVAMLQRVRMGRSSSANCHAPACADGEVVGGVSLCSSVCGWGGRRRQIAMLQRVRMAQPSAAYRCAPACADGEVVGGKSPCSSVCGWRSFRWRYLVLRRCPSRSDEARPSSFSLIQSLSACLTPGPGLGGRDLDWAGKRLSSWHRQSGPPPVEWRARPNRDRSAGCEPPSCHVFFDRAPRGKAVQRACLRG